MKKISFDITLRKLTPIKIRNTQTIKKKRHTKEKNIQNLARTKTYFDFDYSKSQNITIEKPEPEELGEFYEIRKKIIFNKINVNENENEFAKLIFESQSKLNKTMKKVGFFIDIKNNVYNWALDLKENIANYTLVINAYFIAKKNIQANNLFILMNLQNKDKITKIFSEIKKNFQKISNSNRIAKFFPSIIKIFLTILGVLIKLCSKLNKIQLQNYYLKIYLLTIDIVKSTVSEKFITLNSGNENDFKILGRYFFFDCLYKQAIFSFIKYQSFEIIFFMLNYIIDSYKNLDDSLIINSESILLLKTSYNLGLMQYIRKNNQEALSYFNKSISFLDNIDYFPYIVDKQIPNEKTVENKKSNLINSKFIQDKQNPDINIGKKYPRKRSVSVKIDYNNFHTNKEIIFGLKLKFHSVIKFGKEKIIIIETGKNVEIIIKQLIFIEIELIMAEIELNKNNYERAYLHIAYILNTFDIYLDNQNNKLSGARTFQEISQNILNENDKSKNKNINSRILELTDLHRRKICFILEKIEEKIEMIQSGNRYSQKTFEIIKDEPSNESNSSRDNYIKYDGHRNRYNKTFYKEKKLIQAAQNFFLFICSLSYYQLKILNEYQPEQSQKRDELPILFPSQFKDCLTFKQRLALNNLDSMRLSRCMILINSKKEISVNNLNYNIIKTRKKSKKQKNSSIDMGYISTGYSKNYLKKIAKNKKEEESISISNSTNISMDLSSNKMKYMKYYGINLMNTIKKNNLKQKLFEQGKSKFLMEEDDYFKSKIDEIFENGDKYKIIKKKIHKILEKLKPNEKKFLIKDKECIDGFFRNIKKTLHRCKSSFK